MSGSELSLEETLKHLDIMANQALALWDLPGDASAKLINVSENATYLVEGTGWKSILRIHREAYHTERAIECELAWTTALADEGAVRAPGFIAGRDGKAIQLARVPGLPNHRFLVMFEFVEGEQPDEDHDLAGPFEELGEIAARTHIQSIGWQKPEPFERLIWNVDTIFGSDATWGNWRDAPNVTREIKDILERVEATVRGRLEAFGAGPDRYGLIHADMRLANLIYGPDGTELIDFDDCGFGWFLYDFAAGISFMEDHPQIPALKEAWIRGYRKARALSAEEEAEIDTFVMMRRLALLAWIGSHIEAPEPQAMAPDFARVSAELGEAYLGQFA